MIVGGIPMLIGGSVPFLVNAADFDGTNDYALRGAGLTNAADSKMFTFVMWQKSRTLATTFFLDSVNAGLRISNQSNKLKLIGSGGVDLIIDSTYDLSSTAWQCWMVSINMASTGQRHIYLGDDYSLGPVTSYNNVALDFTTTLWSTGSADNGTSKFDGGLAEMMFWTGVYIDFNVEANRRLFFSATGKPVDPNAGAFAALGTPRIYFHLNRGETANNFVANNDGGDGGAFIVTGALSTFATSPSD